MDKAYLPAAQLVHTPPEVANLPAAQSVQSLSASDPADEDLPAAQFVQMPPAAENLPAAQLVQSLPASDPAGEDLPAEQSLHAASPMKGLKLPAAHALHVPPLGPEKPGLHVQDARDALPIAEIAFGGQPSQTSELFAATITENLPAAHD